MAVRKQMQIGLQDQIIDNPDLEQQLEKRQQLKEQASDYRKVDKACKLALKELGIPMPFRIGRFVMTETEIEGRQVSFETSKSSRININVADG